MRALTFKRYGKPDQLALADIPRPTPGPNEILVQVHAAGLNPIDNMIPKGAFKPSSSFNCRPRWAAILRASSSRWEAA